MGKPYRCILYLGAWSTQLLFLSGCAPVISQDVRALVAEDIAFASVLREPEGYTGLVVLWAGEIATATNRQEGTLIEVVQRPMGFRLAPKNTDRSEGRFLALYPGYLDVSIYEKGRKVTVAGPIQGSRTQKLGEMDYRYPLMLVQEIYLWPLLHRERYPYPYAPYFYRGRYYGPYDPLWDGPYWHPWYP